MAFGSAGRASPKSKRPAVLVVYIVKMRGGAWLSISITASEILFRWVYIGVNAGGAIKANMDFIIDISVYLY